MYMDATLHREAMHIQNSAAGGVPGQRSLLFCARTIAQSVEHESANSVTSFREPWPFHHHPLPSPARSTPTSLFSLISSAVSRPCLLSVSIVRAPRASSPLPSPHHLCSLPLRRGALRVLTPRRMSGVMNFNSFTPRHVGVEGRAGAGRGIRGQAKMATSFSPVKLSID